MSWESDATPSATPFFERAYKISHFPGLWASWVDLPSFATSSKIWPNFSYKKVSITKNVLLDWYSSMKKEIEKDSDDIWHRKLTLKVKRLVDFALFDTSPLTQFSKFDNFLWLCWLLAKNLLIFYPMMKVFHNLNDPNSYIFLTPEKVTMAERFLWCWKKKCQQIFSHSYFVRVALPPLKSPMD